MKALVTEAREVGIVGTQDRTVCLHGLFPEQFKAGERRRGPTPFGILGQEVFEVIERDTEGFSFHRRFSSEAQTTSPSFRANTCRLAKAGGA